MSARPSDGHARGEVAERGVAGRVGVDQEDTFAEVGDGGGQVDRRRALADPPFAFVTATLRIVSSLKARDPPAPSRPTSCVEGAEIIVNIGQNLASWPQFSKERRFQGHDIAMSPGFERPTYHVRLVTGHQGTKVTWRLDPLVSR